MQVSGASRKHHKMKVYLLGMVEIPTIKHGDDLGMVYGCLWHLGMIEIPTISFCNMRVLHVFFPTRTFLHIHTTVSYTLVTRG